MSVQKAVLWFLGKRCILYLLHKIIMHACTLFHSCFLLICIKETFSITNSWQGNNCWGDHSFWLCFLVLWLLPFFLYYLIYRYPFCNMNMILPFSLIAKCSFGRSWVFLFLSWALSYFMPVTSLLKYNGELKSQ